MSILTNFGNHKESIMKKILLASIAVVGLWANGAERFAGDEGILRIAGGTAHIPVMKIVASEITKVAPKLKIAIAGGGSGVGIKKVGEGLVDIGNAGRKASDKEIAKYGLVLHKWAIDGIAVVLNNKNHITDMNQSQIQDIFAGKITNWRELGGEDRAITVYTRDKASGTRKVFWKKVLHKGDITQKALFVNSNGAMKRSIESDTASIGFMSAGFVDSSLHAVAIDGVAPTKESIQNGAYSYSRGLYSITKGEPKGTTKKFIEYLLTPHVQHDIVAQKGFIPVK